MDKEEASKVAPRAWLNTSGHTVDAYYFADGKRVAFYRPGGPGASPYYYIHSDNLGSANKITNGSGSVVNSYLYYPWGAIRESTIVVAYDYKYNGQRAVDSAGMYYYGSGSYGRFYDPTLAWWTQADSIVPKPGDPQAGNRYSYTGNNPLKYIDPNGHYYLFIGGMFTTVATNGDAFRQMMTGLGLDPNNPTAGEGWGIFQWGNGTPGDSAGGTTINQAVGDLTTALDGKEDIKIVGHSRGGNLAIEYAARMAEGRVPINDQLKGVYAIDAPLNFADGPLDFLVGPRYVWDYKTGKAIDRFAGLPDKLKAQGVDVDMATFDNKADFPFTSQDTIPGIEGYEWTDTWTLSIRRQVDKHGNVLQNPKTGETINGRTYYRRYGLSHAD